MLETGAHYPLRLDSLPTGWRAGYVGDFAKLIEPGFASGEHNQTGAGIPHLRPMNVDRDGKINLTTVKFVSAAKDTRRLAVGDVLFNNTNSPELVGKTAVINQKGDLAFSNHMTRVLFNEEVLPKFGALQLHFLWMRGYFRYNCVKHVNQASISSTTLARAVPFIWAPQIEQARIVAEIEKQFSRLDDAIASFMRVTVSLKRYRTSVFQAAVEGRLVTTEAEIARRQGRAYETGEQLLDRIKKRRRTVWEERTASTQKKKYVEPLQADKSVLPDLPEGWTWATWEQIGLSQNGRAFPSADYCDTGVKLLRPGNLHEDGRLVWTSQNTRHMPERYERENADLVVRGRELIMNLTAQSLRDEFLGRICLTGIDEHCLLNQRLARLSPVLILPEFALVVFKSGWFRRFVDKLNTGSLIQHMFTSQIAGFAVPLPPLAEQQRIVVEVERHLSVVQRLDAEVFENLTRVGVLKGSVLSSAFRVNTGGDR